MKRAVARSVSASVPVLLALAFNIGITISATAEDTGEILQDPAGSAESPTDADQSTRCPTSANPHKLPFYCVGRRFNAALETLTEDWWGYRTELLNRLGITTIHSYTAQLMGNPSGGQNQGFTYAGTLEVLITWDLQKFLGAPGLSFDTGASYASGRSLSEEYIGNVFTVQSAFSGRGNGRLQQMYLEQQLFDGTLTVALGRLAPASTFATLPVFNNYVNGSINDVPGSLGINDPAFAGSPPGVEWGTQAIYSLTPTIQVATGIYNTNPSAAAGNDGGANFAFQQGNRGALTVAQVSYLHNQGREDAGLPGEYAIGGLYDSNNFSSLSHPPDKVGGNYSFYAMCQQMVYRDGDSRSRKGLTVWGEVALSPKPGVSSMPSFFGGGLSYEGIIPRRENDIASLGVIYGSFSGYTPQTSDETVIEANYGIILRPWLSITPDFQYVINPGGNSSIQNAFVAGAQLSITF
jgi:porin